MATTAVITAQTTAATGNFTVTTNPVTIGIFSAAPINERACVSLWISDGTNYVHAQNQDGTKVMLTQAQRNYCVRWPGAYQLRKSSTVGSIGVYTADSA